MARFSGFITLVTGLNSPLGAAYQLVIRILYVYICDFIFSVDVEMCTCMLVDITEVCLDYHDKRTCYL